MPKIIPIRELKNTASISKYVEETNEPVFITKNGYGSMVIMSIKVYEKEIAKRQMIELINDSLKDIDKTDQKIDGTMFLNEMKTKYGK
ncbi:MAG: type II toxin-antitoxin system Phd/YefM family antitoxin [Acholeplasmataceae bacterium]|jgi:prevent-host-death family protein|nr:type II toxin-antitoxin system Phd/YefM family antitoxin [Acholeplasmataceae bacterium]